MLTSQIMDGGEGEGGQCEGERGEDRNRDRLGERREREMGVVR